MVPRMTLSLPKRVQSLISRFVQSVIPDALITWENLLLVASVTLLPLFYLTVKNWTETWLVILAAISGYGIWRSRLNLKSLFPDSATTWIFVALSFPIVAVFVSILIRGDIHWKLLAQNIDLLNGPSRLFLAGVAFLWMNYKKVRFMDAFNIACSISIILTLPFATVQQLGAPGRYTTSLIDLDEFSQQISALGLLQFVFLVFRTPSSRLILALNIIAVLIAAKLAIASGGRGGWIAAPAVLILIPFIYRGKRIRLMLIALVALLSICSVVLLNKSFYHRALSIYTQARDFQKGSPDMNSSSHRFLMWKISLELIKKNPIKGYATKANLWKPVYEMDPDLTLVKGFTYDQEEPARYTLCAVGDHNQYLGDFVYNGVLGFISRILLLFIPLIIFINRIGLSSQDSYAANAIGICFLIAFAVFGITQGPFSYKLVCSLYGFMIAGLGSEAIKKTD